MNKTQYTLILAVVQFFVIVALYIQNKNLQKQIVVETTVHDFLKGKFGAECNWVDIIDVKGDSIKFYRNGMYQGMSVTETK